MRVVALLAILGVGIALVTTAAAQSVGNGSFEDPAIDNPASTVAWRTSPHWRFKDVWGSAGVTANSGLFMVSSPSTTSGTQTMYMQGAATATQSIFAMTSTQCTARFKAVQRVGNQDPIGIRLQIEIDGASIWNGIPSGSWSYFTTPSFTLGAGAHDFAIRSLNPSNSDNTAFIDDVTTTCSPTLAPAIANSGFETPNMFGSFAYGPAGATWTFYGAGITGNANAFTAGNPSAPNGVQSAFIQMQGYMAQSVLLNAGTYTISFKATQRGNGNSGTQLLRVLVDGVLVGSYQPPTTSYIGYETSPFTIAGSGTHTVRIEGKGNGGTDFTAFVDDVQVRLVSTFRGFTDQGFIAAKWRTMYNDPTLGAGSNPILYGTCLFPLDNCPVPATPPPLPGIWTNANSFQIGLSSFSESRFWLLVMNNEPNFETSCNTGPPDQSMAHANPPAVFGAVPVMDTGAGENFYRAHLVMNMGTAPSCARGKIPYMSVGAHTNRGNASATGTQYALAALNPTAGVPHSVGFTARLFQYLTPTRVPFTPEDVAPAGLWLRFLALASWPSADGSKIIPRMIFVNLFHDNYADSSASGPQLLKWNYPMLANSWYPGAEVVYFDAERVLQLCNFNVRRMVPGDISTAAELKYDIDLQALFACAGKVWSGGPVNTGGFSNPMPATANIPVTMIDFAVEGFADQGWIAPAISNMVTH